MTDDQKEERLREMLVNPHLLSAGLSTNPASCWSKIVNFQAHFVWWTFAQAEEAAFPQCRNRRQRFRDFVSLLSAVAPPTLVPPAAAGAGCFGGWDRCWWSAGFGGRMTCLRPTLLCFATTKNPTKSHSLKQVVCRLASHFIDLYEIS